MWSRFGPKPARCDPWLALYPTLILILRRGQSYPRSTEPCNLTQMLWLWRRRYVGVLLVNVFHHDECCSWQYQHDRFAAAGWKRAPAAPGRPSIDASASGRTTLTAATLMAPDRPSATASAQNSAAATVSPLSGEKNVSGAPSHPTAAASASGSAVADAPPQAIVRYHRSILPEGRELAPVSRYALICSL